MTLSKRFDVWVQGVIGQLLEIRADITSLNFGSGESKISRLIDFLNEHPGRPLPKKCAGRGCLGTFLQGGGQEQRYCSAKCRDAASKKTRRDSLRMRVESLHTSGFSTSEIVRTIGLKEVWEMVVDGWVKKYQKMMGGG